MAGEEMMGAEVVQLVTMEGENGMLVFGLPWRFKDDKYC